MRIRMNKSILLALLLVIIAAKSDEPTILNSGTLFINSDGTGELSRLDFSKDDQNLIGYKVNTTGDYKIEYKGQSGATNLLRGTANGLSSTGVSYPISGSDTFRVKNVSNNAIVKTIIMEPSAGDLFKMIYGAKRYPAYNQTQTTDYINNWLINTMPTLKFERIY